jgi:hypothetical protein
MLMAVGRIYNDEHTQSEAGNKSSSLVTNQCILGRRCPLMLYTLTSEEQSTQFRWGFLSGGCGEDDVHHLTQPSQGASSTGFVPPYCDLSCLGGLQDYFKACRLHVPAVIGGRIGHRTEVLPLVLFVWATATREAERLGDLAVMRIDYRD